MKKVLHFLPRKKEKDRQGKSEKGARIHKESIADERVSGIPIRHYF
jgi:hypothetical protein